MPTKASTVKSTKKKVVKKKSIRKLMEPPVKTENTEAIKAAVKKVVKAATKKKTPPKKKIVKKKAAAPKKKAPPKPRKPRKRGMYYIDRKELLQDVIDSKAEGEMSDPLASKLVLLTTKYARSANFARYTYNDDMQGYAMMMLVRSWASFKPEKSDNPFAFYTQCIKNSFKQFLNQEKRHRNIRDGLLVDKGMNPSYTYETEYKEKAAAAEVAEAS